MAPAERASAPTIRQRRLAAELRRLRERHQLTADQAARQLGWDPSKLSRFETGRRPIPLKALGELMELYGVTDQNRRESLLSLARHSRQRGWWDAYADTLPTELATYISVEAEASSLRHFYAQIVPGLLQTENYARTIIRAALMSFSPLAEVERRVDVRKTRQEILTRDDPLDYWVVLTEAVLRTQVGTPEIMRDQYEHLIELANLPHITLQVLPFTRGAHPATAGSFSILGFPERYDDDVVYIETMTSSLWIEDDGDVHRFSVAFDHLRATAHGPEESVELIAEIAHKI